MDIYAMFTVFISLYYFIHTVLHDLSTHLFISLLSPASISGYTARPIAIKYGENANVYGILEAIVAVFFSLVFLNIFLHRLCQYT